MKTLISTFALALALAFTAPAFAGDVTAAKTAADCEKARRHVGCANFQVLGESPVSCCGFPIEGVDFGRRLFCCQH